MKRPPRAFTSAAIAVCAALALLVATAANAAISYEHESEAAFAQQLAAKQIRSATINPFERSLHLTLTDGRHVLARYPKHHAPQTAAKLKARGVSVTVLTKVQADEETKAKPKHHKIRYIVGAVVIAVIMIVGAVLLVNRRRQRD